jgi:hypothetical protein
MRFGRWDKPFSLLLTIDSHRGSWRIGECYLMGALMREFAVFGLAQFWPNFPALKRRSLFLSESIFENRVLEP